MKEVTLSPPAPGSTSPKLTFTLVADGRKTADRKFDPKSPKAQAQIAKDCGVDVATVLGWCDAAQTPDEEGNLVAKKFLVGNDDLGRPPLRLFVRGIQQKRDGATAYEAAPNETPLALLDRVLPLVGPEQIVEWDKADADRLAMLDGDYHDEGGRPSAEWVETTLRGRMRTLGPRWHLTRRGGFHSYYEGTPTLAANEVAALAALEWKGIDPTAGVEIKTVTRGLPVGVTLVVNPSARVPEDAATAWLSNGGGEGVNDDAVQAWLDEHGMESGGRYSHDRCPIEPGIESHGDPVVVGDDGISCHRCRGLGRAVRGGRPGFISWAVLTGGSEVSVLRSLVANQTHWGHAKWVLRAAADLDGPVAKLAYSAAIKAYHGGKETAALTPLVFHSDTDHLVRFDGYWGNVEEGHVYPSNIDDLLAVVPASCVVDDDGKVKAAKSSVTLLKQSGMRAAFTERGYPAVQVIRGIRLHRTYTDPSRLVVSSPAPWLEPYKTTMYPRYMDRKSRMSVEKAQEILEAVLPGINWTYLRALLLARACNEARHGLPQHLLVTGVSKAGKTSHVKLAAGILGDVASEPLYVADIERFRSQVRDASQTGSFVSFDEFIKNTTRASPKMTAVQAMDPLLNFTPGSLSHKMYVGPVKMGHVGVCIWTETWVPEVLRNNTQIARRVHYIKLARKVEWEKGLTANGISEIEKVRVLSEEHAAACNAILSDLMDKYLGIPQTFDQLAEQIEVTTLENSPDFYDPTPKLLEFYRLVCEASDPDSVEAKKFEGPGWKVINRENANDDLVTIWTHLADGPRGQWLTSRQVAEKDWGSILGVPAEVHCDLRNDGSGRVAVRFRVGTMQQPTKLNGEIIDVAK